MVLSVVCYVHDPSKGFVSHQDLSLEVKPGQITALVGLNTSGKTTCVKLLERFYQPQAGEILLDGKPLMSYEDEYLRKTVSGWKGFRFYSS